MPPPGGFEAIKYKRNLPLKGPSGLVMFLGVMGITSFGMYRVLQGRAEQRFESNALLLWLCTLIACFSELKREKVWSRIHLTPLLIAEADRDAYRREQAALAREKAIMKDVPGWEVSVYGLYVGIF